MAYNKRIRKAIDKKQTNVPEYGIGGWISDTWENAKENPLKSIGKALLVAGTGGTGSAILGAGYLAKKGFGKLKDKLTPADPEVLGAPESMQYANFDDQEIIPGQEAYTQLMPYGGYVQTRTVELEKGEPYRLPSGEIESIPTTAPSHAEGGVIIDLPAGTEVLGKKKSSNGKQFKEMGRKLKKAQDKYNKKLKDNPTSIETKTSKRMLDKVQKEYTKLFNEQGEGVQGQYANGGVVYKGDPRIERGFNYLTDSEKYRKAKKGDIVSKTPFYDPNNDQLLGYKERRKGGKEEYVFINNSQNNTNIDPSVKRFSDSELPEFAKGGKIPQYQVGGLSSMIGEANPTAGKVWDIGGELVNSGMQLAPAAYNIYQGLQPVEKIDAARYYNPYENRSRRLLQSRRYDVTPEMERSQSDLAGLRQGYREIGLSKAQMMGGLQSANIAKTRADAAALSRAQNINAQYMADLAKFEDASGQNIARTRAGVDEINAQNEAARKAYIAKGLEQISSFAQRRQQAKSQQASDQASIDAASAANPSVDQSTLPTSQVSGGINTPISGGMSTIDYGQMPPIDPSMAFPTAPGAFANGGMVGMSKQDQEKYMKMLMRLGPQGISALASSLGVGGAGAAGAAGAAGGLGALAALSDKRLKENLIPVGKLDNGLTVYIGNYKKETGLDIKPQLFLIAQEVQEVNPEAVVEMDNGYLAVNYSEAIK